MRFFSATKDKEFMMHTLRKIKYEVHVTMMNIAMSNQIGMKTVHDKISTIHDTAFVNKLASVAGSQFNHDDRLGCMQGTRVQILASLFEWAVDLKSPQLLYLSGEAGTGKKTVLESFCRMLDSQSLLGAIFFCSHKSKERADLSNVFPSLTRGIARAYPQFLPELAKELSQCFNPMGMNINDQCRILNRDNSEAVEDSSLPVPIFLFRYLSSSLPILLVSFLGSYSLC
ncbi:hypothetical protein M422DRAFT_239197 [Sphaerobolus stellatus SS14]|nr:hypothetical protein M422DRAFT_239197 [Sphaerobolus stellatus SS14]